MTKPEAKNFIQNIIYNPLFIVILGLITFLSWMTDQSVTGMVALLLIGSVILIFNKDILPLLPCLIYTIYCTSNSNILSIKSNIIIFVIVCLIFSICLIAHFFIYKPKFKLFKLTIPLILVSLALFLGGIGFLSFKEYFKGITFMLSLGPLLLFLYYFIMLFLSPPSWVNARNYLCYIMIVLGVVVLGQFAMFVIRADLPILDLIRVVMDVGWGNRNGIAMTLVLCFPCAFYIAFGKKRMAVPFYLLSFIMYFVVIFIYSRGGVVASSITMLALVIYSTIKAPNKSYFFNSIAIVIIILSIFAIISPDTILAIIDKLTSFDGIGSSGRDSLFKEAYKLFIENPIFGAGVGYIGNIFSVPEFCMYWFHSTLFQVIGNMGLVGIIAYSIFYITRGITMFSSLKPFNILLSMAIIGFEIHSMVDVGTFNPFPFMFIIIVMSAFLEYSNSLDHVSTDTIQLSV